MRRDWSSGSGRRAGSSGFDRRVRQVHTADEVCKVCEASIVDQLGEANG